MKWYVLSPHLITYTSSFRRTTSEFRPPAAHSNYSNELPIVRRSAIAADVDSNASAGTATDLTTMNKYHKQVKLTHADTQTCDIHAGFTVQTESSDTITKPRV